MKHQVVGAFSAFLFVVVGNSVAAETNPCQLLDPSSSQVSHQSEGTIPHYNGQVAFDSRRQRKNGRMQFVWSVTENSSGYTVDVAWGSDSNETAYFGGLVKDGISSPRCKAQSSRREAEFEDRVFKFRRPLFSWNSEEVETVIRSSLNETKGPSITLDDIFSLFIGTATAQTASDIARLEQEALNGTLPEALQPYYDFAEGLDVQGLISDPEALEVYTANGYQPLTEWSFAVTDLPNSTSALERLGTENGIFPEELTPTLFSVVTLLEPSDGSYRVEYSIQARILDLDGELTKHDPIAFSEIGYSPRFLTPNEELSVQLENAIEERTGGVFISPIPGSEPIRISSFRSDIFSLAENATLVISAGEFSLSVLDFAVILPSAQ